MDEKEARVRLATIIVVGIVAVASIIGLTLTALFTDRNLSGAGLFVFFVIIALATISGVSLLTWRRRKHRIHLDIGNGEDDE